MRYTHAIRLFLSCILTLFVAKAYATQEVYFLNTYGNVSVRVSDLGAYAPTEKAEFIGMLTQKLCQRLNYKKPVFVDLNSIVYARTSMFVLFDKGENNMFQHEYKKVKYEPDALLVRGMMRNDDIPKLLKLIEHGINNEQHIREQQSKRAPLDNETSFPTMDTSERNKIMSGSSVIVDSLMSIRLNRPSHRGHSLPVKKNGHKQITYYFQNNKYCIYSHEYPARDSIILKLDNVCLLFHVSPGEALVFDSDSTFYYVNTVCRTYTGRTFLPALVKGRSLVKTRSIGFGRVELFFRYFSMLEPTHKTCLFYTPSIGAFVEVPKEQ